MQLLREPFANFEKDSDVMYDPTILSTEKKQKSGET